MIYLIANEKHLKGKNAKKLDVIKSVFDYAKKDCEVLFTKAAGDAKTFTENITSSGEAHTVVAVGGDGTLHEVLNGFKNFESCSLGLIPIGSGNDFAASANIPLDVKKAAEIIAFRAPVHIDFIEFSNGLRSINIAGMGIDVDVLHKAYSCNYKGKSKYAKALLACLRHFESTKYVARYSNNEEMHVGLMTAVCNGKQLGGGMKICPDASINDGYIEVFIVDYISKIKILGAFIKIMTGKVDKIKEAKSVKVKSVQIVPLGGNKMMQADGELYENVAFEAHVVPERLRFYLPQIIN